MAILELMQSSRAHWAIDALALAMLVVIPLSMVSFSIVKFFRQTRLHLWLQVAISVVMGVFLLAFELSIRIVGWREQAEVSPYYESYLLALLFLHLLCAVPAVGLWYYTLYKALKEFSFSAKPGKYSMMHRRMGWVSYLFLLMANLTGYGFYYLAFIAE